MYDSRLFSNLVQQAAHIDSAAHTDITGTQAARIDSISETPSRLPLPPHLLSLPHRLPPPHLQQARQSPRRDWGEGWMEEESDIGREEGGQGKWERGVGGEVHDISNWGLMGAVDEVIGATGEVARQLLQHSHACTHEDMLSQRHAAHAAATRDAHCNTLQHTATHCNTLQHTAHTAHTATNCNRLQHTATHSNTL